MQNPIFRTNGILIAIKHPMSIIWRDPYVRHWTRKIVEVLFLRIQPLKIVQISFIFPKQKLVGWKKYPAKQIFKFISTRIDPHISKLTSYPLRISCCTRISPPVFEGSEGPPTKANSFISVKVFACKLPCFSVISLIQVEKRNTPKKVGWYTSLNLDFLFVFPILV